MDERIRASLTRYLTDVRSLPNESAKTHRFIALIESLFPGSPVVTELASGVEKIVRVDFEEGSKPRRIDTYHGNAVIEFEKSLKATEAEAKRQLREQVAGLWRDDADRPLICVASDGVVWKTFRPRLKGTDLPPAGSRKVAEPPATPHPADIELVPLRDFILTNDTLDDFWIWLTNLLFRDARTEPTAERFRIDFGASSLAFSEAIDALSAAWKEAKAEPEAKLAFDTWKKYLTLTYGSLTGPAGARPELEKLFLKHTFLACLARLLVWSALSDGRTKKPLREVAEEVLSGRYFRGEGIENLVEDDFFQWVQRASAEKILAPVWERTIAQLQTYDLARLDQDVFKGVYQELVDPKDRHDLGEYYTPEWLCERIVDEMLPEEGFASVIDPACGSGSFLRAAIAHLLCANPGGGAMRLRKILDSVVGIDIHPLAVTISRATYALGLGSLIKATKRPIQIPVYLADSLFLPTEVTQYELGDEPAYEITFGGRRVQIAEDLVRSPDLFDPAISACYRVAVDHAETKAESQESLAAYLRRDLPHLATRPDFEAITKGLWRFTEELASLIRERKNSIWAFIVRNGYRPAMLKRRFDFVIGNPPWLSYRYIADPAYQGEVKRRAVDQYQVAPKAQRLVTQMELATVFLAHALTTFGNDEARLGFVMPRSVLSADQHSQLRERKYRAPLTIERYWDLWDVKPLFNVPSCVLFARRETPSPRISYKLPAVEWTGRLPRRDVTWSEASRFLDAQEKTARLIYLASRSALSTAEGRTKPFKGSTYRSRFRQGATILPRNFYFVSIRDLEPDAEIDAERVYWAETEPEQAERAKPPYRDVRMEGPVEGGFLFLTALSENVVPFALVNPKQVVLPVQWDGRKLRVRTADHLRSAGYREMAKWMREAEEIWKDKRGKKAKRESVYGWLDYQGKLTAQNLGQRHLVLYNAGGTNISATLVDREALPGRFLVEHKLYWAACRTIQEADYLVAILNSEVVNGAIKPFQSTGLMGERDIEKKVLDLPIPEFQASNPGLLALAELGERARNEAAAFLAGAKLPRSLAQRRGLVRQVLRETLDAIDEGVRVLLR